MTYAEKVLVIVRSKIIDRAMGMITKGELAKATHDLETGGPTLVQSCLGQLQLPHKCARGQAFYGAKTPTTAPDLTVPKEFCLDNVQGHVCTTWRVTIPLFGTVNIHGKTEI